MNNLNKRNKYLFKNIFSFFILKEGLTVLFCFLNFFAYLQKTDSIIHQKYYYKTGNLSSEGYTENRIPVGPWKNYYESGIIKSEGKKSAGKSEGKWTFYSSQGQIEKEIEYKENLKNGRYQQFDSLGQLITESYYKNDTLIGLLKVFKNGMLAIETNYEQGLKSGVEKIYDEKDGRLTETINYFKDVKLDNMVINQLDPKNQKKGLWRTFYPDGKLRKECFYDNNRQIGNCKEWNERGILVQDISQVDFKNEIDIRQTFHANGKIAQFQAYLNTYKNGVGSLYDSLGNLLESKIYKSDTLLAKGFILASGIYDSTWIYFYPNLQKSAVGKYKNGIKVGEWTYFDESGAPVQIGKYRKGITDGEWIWYYNNGQIKRKETYMVGKRQGLSIEFDSLGKKIAEGNYIDDIQDGSWFYEKNNLTEKGIFKMGLKEGEWKHYYKEKTLCFKGTFRSNIPIGKHYFYFNNGQIIKSGKFKKGLKTGEWRTFNKDGVFIHSYYYNKGKLISIDGEKAIVYE